MPTSGHTRSSPQSIKSRDTQILRLAHLIYNHKTSMERDYWLPLYRDWIFTPSTTSRVPPRPHYSNPFRYASLWDSSEVKIVRVAHLLTKVAREALVLHTGLRLRAWMMMMGSSKAALNGCTKFFTLEREEQDGDFVQEDFRDAIALTALW